MTAKRTLYIRILKLVFTWTQTQTVRVSILYRLHMMVSGKISNLISAVPFSTINVYLVLLEKRWWWWWFQIKVLFKDQWMLTPKSSFKLMFIHLTWWRDRSVLLVSRMTNTNRVFLNATSLVQGSWDVLYLSKVLGGIYRALNWKKIIQGKLK